jgi:anaphase-promoting complex subunit 6
MPLHIGAALELGRKNDLFLRAHNLVQEYPNK